MIPASVWSNPVKVDVSWMRGLFREKGAVQLLGDARREYALAKFLRQARVIDSITPLRWVSWYGVLENEFTGAYKVRSTGGFMVVAVREDANDALLDVVAAHDGLVVVASSTAIPNLKPIHTIELGHG